MGLFDGNSNQPWDIKQVRELHWRELELLLGVALEEKGYEVEVTQRAFINKNDILIERLSAFQ